MKSYRKKYQVKLLFVKFMKKKNTPLVHLLPHSKFSLSFYLWSGETRTFWLSEFVFNLYFIFSSRIHKLISMKIKLFILFLLDANPMTSIFSLIFTDLTDLFVIYSFSFRLLHSNKWSSCLLNISQRMLQWICNQISISVKSKNSEW